jgi:DNA polymerase III epsilon subunit-like protein
MNILVFDTETTSLEKPFCYNIGYTIYDTDNAEKLLSRDYVVEQVWHNPMLFTTAYYADKRELYVSRMRSRKAKLEKFGYITQQMYRDIKDFDISLAFAYNSPFDVGVFTYNCEWFKTINPFDTIKVIDIRGYVHKAIAFSEDFQNFCDTNGYYTESGNYSTTAETVYRYISGNTDFIEEHTALADSLIECDILAHCCGINCVFGEEYKVYATVPRYEIKTFEIIDSEGNEYCFEYTNKRKLPNKDGLKFTIKEPKKN